MIGVTRKVEVAPLQSEANASFNPFPATENATDIQSIKTAFLADPDIIEAFKGDAGPQGQQGPQGQTGPAGDSVIVMSADPTDAVMSKIGDLYLNATSGTLYQRSGITQAQFYATGQQGIVLPNSIWIRKGNLKGATGAKGDKGDGIINGSGHPKSTITILPEVGTLYLNKDTFSMYQRSATEFLTPPVQQGVTDYSDGYWQFIGSLKGENGEKGENGKSSFEVLQGTGIFLLTNEHIGKTLVIKADSAITNIRYNNVTTQGKTVFLIEKDVLFTKTNTSPATALEGFSGDYLILENYSEPVNGLWLNKKSLEGQVGENGKDAVEILEGTGIVSLADSQLGKILIIESDSAITGISFANTSVATTTTFICLKELVDGISYYPTLTNGTLPAQVEQVNSGDFFAIKNYTSPQNGLWLTKTDLKSGTRIKTGTNHLTFTDAKTGDLYINTNTWNVWKFTSAADALSEFPVWDNLGSIKGQNLLYEKYNTYAEFNDATNKDGFCFVRFDETDSYTSSMYFVDSQNVYFIPMSQI